MTRRPPSARRDADRMSGVGFATVARLSPVERRYVCDAAATPTSADAGDIGDFLQALSSGSLASREVRRLRRGNPA